jgi:hypothetical protein
MVEGAFFINDSKCNSLIMKRISFFMIFMLLITGSAAYGQTCNDQRMVDSLATRETKALYKNLKISILKGILIGHQDAFAYGVKWKSDAFRSDMHDVCGKHPAVFGWDLSKIEHGSLYNIDSVLFSDMRRWIIEAFNRGGVITISWHIDNPVSGGNAWDTSPAIRDILPGGSKHQLFNTYLDKAADFLSSLKNEQGIMIPIIFRPWHENDGNWFWWGQTSCSVDEYKALWRYTIEYLRDVKNIHHLIYAYSWGDASSLNNYMVRYPGHDWVDVIGCDIYGYLDKPENISKLAVISSIAVNYNKIAALTECGVESCPDSDLFTQHILKPIGSKSATIHLSYMLFWRNAHAKHYFVPYQGQLSASDFIHFEQDTHTLFLEDIPPMYQ